MLRNFFDQVRAGISSLMCFVKKPAVKQAHWHIGSGMILHPALSSVMPAVCARIGVPHCLIATVSLFCVLALSHLLATLVLSAMGD